MKKFIQKTVSVLICAVMLFALTPKTNAATYTAAQFNSKLEEVKKMYPQGSQQVDWFVNGSKVGSQCHGYARWLSFYVWGVDFANGNGAGWVRYDSTATTTAIDKLVPGDVLRYRTSATKTSNHSIFVTAIDGDTVYFTDCNSDGKSTIKWERSATKSYLEEHLKMKRADIAEYGYIAHYTPNTLSANGRLTVNYNANGGVLNLPTQKITQYTVKSNNGVNMRSGAGTEYGKVGSMPNGTVFTVTESKSDSKGEYVWGKTTYNGVTGWCVISASWVTKTETEIPASHYLNNEGDICITDTQAPFKESFLFGSTYSEGLLNPAEVNLTKENHTFLGWSKTKEGKEIIPFDQPITPETIFPEADGKDFSATLYAVWQSNKVLTGIEVASPPSKTKYLLNAPFSSSGLKITLKYSNNTEETITEGFTLSEFDSATAGEKTITVSYNDKQTTFNVLVEALKTGDINSDLNIDLVDVTLVAQYIAKWAVECNPEAMDVNSDGDITLIDVVHLSQYIAGWEGIVLK